MPSGRATPTCSGRDNGSARIQVPRVKTQTPTRWIVTGEEQGLRLDRFLAAPERIGSRGRVRVALDRGKVFVNDSEVSSQDAGSRVKSGDVVRLWIDRPGTAKRRLGAFRSGDLHILYEDDTLLVLNKPAGLLAVPLDSREAAPSLYEQDRGPSSLSR